MERAINIHLRLSYDFRTLRTWMVLVLLVLPAGDLASESVTLTTYYPAPSGVYTQMITTNNTYLARDGGAVGIGTIFPGAKLDVQNTAPGMAGNFGTTATCCGGGNPTLGLSENTSVNGRLPWLQFHASGFQEAYMRLAKDARVFELGDNQGAGVDLAILNPAGTTRSVILSAKGASYFNGNVGIGASPSATGRGYLFIDNTNTGCSEQDVTQGPICGAGQYATFQPGVYVEGWNYANRGGQVLAYAVDGTPPSGASTYKVWGMLGSGKWMSLWKDDRSAHVFCCPK